MRATTLVRLACTLLGAAAGCNGSDPGGERRVGPESVVIGLPARLGALERPAVEFDHGKHAKALEQKCETCHPEVKPGELSPKIGRLADGDDRGALIDLYHAQCRGCHARRAKEKQLTGPMMCGDCHVRRPAAIATRREIAFAQPLHDLHVEIAENKCATCHHHAAEGATPPPCKSCHGDAAATKDRPGPSEAYHRKCIGCHRAMGLDDGCAYCHERAAREVRR